MEEGIRDERNKTTPVAEGDWAGFTGKGAEISSLYPEIFMRLIDQSDQRNTKKKKKKEKSLSFFLKEIGKILKNK